MHNNKNYNVDPRAMADSNVAGATKESERRIVNRINELRSEGLSEDDIFLMIIEENSKHNFKTKKDQPSKEKTLVKRFTYNSDIFKK